MIIDFHTHIGRSVDGAEETLPDILRDMREFHISKAVAFPIDEKNPGPSYARPNHRIAGFVKQHKNLIGCARLDPNKMKASLQEIERAVHNGFRAVKLHPRTDRFGVGRAAPLFETIQKHRLIVILHTDHEPRCHPKQWLHIFEAYPKTFFVLTHAGKDLYRDAIEVANRYRNVYLDTSTLSYHRTGVILRKVGVRKVLFASDVPYSHMGLEMAKFKFLLSRSKQKLVFSENARRILEI